MLQSKWQTKEQQYYQIIRIRYGPDVAMLTMVRVSEIYRLTWEELARNSDKAIGLVSFGELSSSFIARIKVLLEKAQLLLAMFAADEDVRGWFAMWLLERLNNRAAGKN